MGFEGSDSNRLHLSKDEMLEKSYSRVDGKDSLRSNAIASLAYQSQNAGRAVQANSTDCW